MSNDTNTFEDKISLFLKRNFPQIQLHGGESTILKADEETGSVHINLSGACSGCGISPMTVEAIKRRMFQEIESVTEIEVTTGIDDINSLNQPVSFGRKDDKKDTDSEVQAPF